MPVADREARRQETGQGAPDLDVLAGTYPKTRLAGTPRPARLPLSHKGRPLRVNRGKGVVAVVLG